MRSTVTSRLGVYCPSNMLRLGSLSAWISVDDEELPEYGVEVSEDGKETTCWIPSKVGQQFAINWKCASRIRRPRRKLATPLGVRLFLDGTQFSGGHMEKPTTVTKGGVPTSHTTMKPFVFSKAELTDDDNFLAVPSGIGEIQMVVYEISIENTKRSLSYFVAELPQKVHERSKKGIVHGVGLANNVQRPIRSRVTELSASKKFLRKLVTFVFKYRPLDVLQANNIAPSQSLVKPKIEEHDEDPDTLAENKRALQAALRREEDLEPSQKRKGNFGPRARGAKKARQDSEDINLA